MFETISRILFQTNLVFSKKTILKLYFSDSFCKRKDLGEEDFIPQIENSGVLKEIKNILDPIVRKADRVAFIETTNEAERFVIKL